MDRFRVARFECEGDVREVFVSAEGDELVICEELSGPSAQVAFGEKSRVRAVRLSAHVVSKVMSEIGFAGSEDALWSYLSDERRDLADLVGLCRGWGIPCEVASCSEGCGVSAAAA